MYINAFTRCRFLNSSSSRTKRDIFSSRGNILFFIYFRTYNYCYHRSVTSRFKCNIDKFLRCKKEKKKILFAYYEWCRNAINWQEYFSSMIVSLEVFSTSLISFFSRNVRSDMKKKNVTFENLSFAYKWNSVGQDATIVNLVINAYNKDVYYLLH